MQHQLAKKRNKRLIYYTYIGNNKKKILPRKKGARKYYIKSAQTQRCQKSQKEFELKKKTNQYKICIARN